MASSLSIPRPLQSVKIQDLQRLGQCIWNWKLCDLCNSGSRTCAKSNCSWSDSARLEYFWTRYKQITSAYIPEFFAVPALTSHEDLLKIISSIKDQPDLTRNQLLKKNFVDGIANPGEHVDITDRSRALNMATSILLMMNCGTLLDCAEFPMEESSGFSWRGSLNASEFIAEALPKNAHSSTLHNFDAVKRPDFFESLRATSLIRRGFTFEPTDDLRSHLILDHNTRAIRIFQGSAVLKETLLATRNDLNSCLLPRAIAREVLDTIHNILFPSGHETYALVRSLILKHRFDADLLRYESARFKREDDEEQSYAYFGHRIVEIYDAVQTPKPRGRVGNWLQRNSGTRHMLLATMIGVFIAVILGFLGLVVAALQAWVAYQQWQHPVCDN